nr:hypothetical protein [Tanacetum cinerariifolium]
IYSEPKSKNKGKGIMVQKPKPLKKQAQIEQDEAYARELEAELNKNINWDNVIEQVQRKEKEENIVLRFKMDYFKGMSYEAIRPIFEKYFNSNGEIIANTDADKDVTLKDVAAVAKEVEAEKNAKVEKDVDVQGRLEESQAKVYHINLEHADKVLI